MRYLLLGVLAGAMAGAAAAPAAPSVPLAAAKAQELAPLPGGGWLALEKRALVLVDGAGAERARLPLRGERLDLRPAAGGALGVVLEADTQRTLAVDVDTTAMTLSLRPLVEPPGYTVDALCLWTDGQGLTHLFVIGDEGFAEQWLVRERAAPLSVRRLAVPPGVERCRVDDAGGWLYVAEPGVGLWAVRADPEDAPQRHLVSWVKPRGPLASGPLAFAPLPGGIALHDGQQLRLLERREGARWVPVQTFPMPARGAVEQLQVVMQQGRAQLAWREEARKAWVGRTVAWSRTAEASLPTRLPVVVPIAQTAPVSRAGDAADDPAIWVHPTDPAASRVLGTNKREGLLVYDVSGREIQTLPIGRLNNVDVRQGVVLGGRSRDLAVATHRDALALVVFEIDPQGRVTEIGRVPTGLEGIYGVCVHGPQAGGLEVFVNDSDGTYLRIALSEQAGQVVGRELQRWRMGSQPEGCVADDRAGRLWVGEEDRGLWMMRIDPAPVAGSAPVLTMVLPVGRTLHADVEGVALYDSPQGRWIVVSSQGNNSFVVLDADPPHRVRGAFRIGISAAAAIDGVSETDGLEVTSRPLGPSLPAGALVVQDGYKRLPAGPQNFKIIDWRDVERVLGLPQAR
jgi:3-phytase